jgi:hypothetical protein
MKILALYLSGEFILNIISTWLIKDYWIDLGLWHVNVVFEFVCIMSIILFFQELKVMKRLFKLLLPAYLIFWLCAKFTVEPFNGLYSITVSASQVILALSAGYTLFIVIGNNMQSLLNHQRFWVLLSFVIYFIGTLIPLTLTGLLYYKLGESLLSLWLINLIVIIISNILFTISYLCPQTRL